jgi:acyl dehydratase
VDIDYARNAGLPDVFAHGMLSMAWLGQVLTRWVPQHAIRSFSVRFVALTNVGERISCSGKVVEKLVRDGERLVRVELTTRNAQGQIKLSGEALVALPIP